MNGMADLEERQEASTASLALVAWLLIGTALGFVFATAPLGALLGSARGAIPATFHGVAAFLYLMALSFFYLVVAFGLGAAVTKLRAA